MLPIGVIAETGRLPNVGAAALVPIRDGANRPVCSEEEGILRLKLAALYRLVDIFHWSQSIFNHLTVRVPSKDDQILINPFGQLYNEVTDASLVKVDLLGNVIDGGSTEYGINQAGYVIHSAIHEARPDVVCVIHLHIPAVAAVASMKCGLQPICQESMIVGRVAYHTYEGIVVDCEEKTRLVANLGNHDVMLLRNHGFVVCGSSVEHALHLAYHLIIACQTQVAVMAAGDLDNIHLPSEEAQEKAFSVAKRGGGGVNRIGGQVTVRSEVGVLEWTAWMRSLDRLGLDTGYQTYTR